MESYAMKTKQARPRWTVQSYLAEEVCYGGLMVTRGEMIADLQETARASGHPNPQALVNAYLAGHSRRMELDAAAEKTSGKTSDCG
jgi:hypothetical protein